MTKENEWWLRATESQIIQELKDCCSAIPAGQTRTTVELVELAFPQMTCRGAGIDRRKHLFTRLMKGADTHFKGYFSRGPAVQGAFGQKRPYLWHAPKNICPLCGGTGLV